MTRIITTVLFLILACNVNAETRVTQQPFKDIAVYPSIKIPASAISLNDAKISAEVSATVKNISVFVGDTVKKNDILIELDAKDYELNLQRAQVALKGIESRLKLANYQLKQAKALSKENVISDDVLRQRSAEATTLQAELETQKVAVDIARRALNKCQIRAPYAAVVAERIAQVGELANSGTALLRIVDVSLVEVSTKIQSRDVVSFEQTDSFQFETFDNIYPVKIRKLSPIIDTVQRNREARLVFTDKKAPSGSTGSLVWQQTQAHVPANLIVRRGGKLGVFTLQDETAKFVAIPGATEGRPSSVKLDLDTPIIIDGRYSVKDGDKITF